MKRTALIILLKNQSVLDSSVACLFGHHQVSVCRLPICILIENILNSNLFTTVSLRVYNSKYMISGDNGFGLCKVPVWTGQHILNIMEGHMSYGTHNKLDVPLVQKGMDVKT